MSAAKHIVILAEQRSGSTWLQVMIAANGFADLREPFHMLDVQGVPWSSVLPEYRKKYHKAPTVAKWQRNQLRTLFGSTNVDRAISNVYGLPLSNTLLVAVRRRDSVAQAVSLWLSLATNRWHSAWTANRPIPPYDETEAVKVYTYLASYCKWYDTELPERAVQLWYEDLANDPVTELARVSHELGLARWRTVSTEHDRFDTDVKYGYAMRLRADLERRKIKLYNHNDSQ